MKKILTVVSCVLMTAPCMAADYCAPEKLPKAVVSKEYSDLFASQYGPGWIGADSTYSAKLPDGREAWVFSDTFIGTAEPDGTATLKGMPHNSELVGSSKALISDYAGTYDKPDSLIPDTNPGKWFWAFSTYIENGKQLIFISEFDNQNIFGNYTGVSAIATMEVPEKGMPRFSGLTLLPSDIQHSWGAAAMRDGTYRYIYGHTPNGDISKPAVMTLARVPLGYSTDTAKWEFWDGKGWVHEFSSVAPILTGNMLNGVMLQPEWMGKGYVAVSIPSGVFVDNTLDVSFACAPQGPWSKPVPVYTLPEITGPAAYKNEIAYLPTVHPELGGEHNIIASYNVNNVGGGLGAYQKDIRVYQPRFLTLGY